MTNIEGTENVLLIGLRCSVLSLALVPGLAFWLAVPERPAYAAAAMLTVGWYVAGRFDG